MKNIYLYGMIIASNSFRLKEFLKPDEYSEIEESFRAEKPAPVQRCCPPLERMWYLTGHI